MKKILIVEDDEQYRKILDEELTAQGYEVHVASNGNLALDMLKEGNVDLILLDLLMPVMDGVTFYYNLKDKLKLKTPIIVLTNVSDTKAYGENIKDVLIKSNVSLKEVIEKVNKYI
jgi:DNA-binding response OmpR family regulator